MLPAIIALLMMLNLISSPAEWDTLSDSEKNDLIEVINTDVDISLIQNGVLEMRDTVFELKKRNREVCWCELSSRFNLKAA